MCAYHCAQLSYTTQHRTVVIIFPLILQRIFIAHIMLLSIRVEGTLRSAAATLRGVRRAYRRQ